MRHLPPPVLSDHAVPFESRRVAGTAALLAMLLSGAATAEFTPEWQTTFVDGAGYVPRAMAVDDSGASYVLAEIDVAAFDTDLLITRFEPDGSVGWQHQHAGPAGQDIAVDLVLAADGNAVYAVGRSATPSTSADYAIVRLHRMTGEPEWVRYHDGPAGGIDDPRDAAPTPDGGVVVTGSVWNDDERSDFGTVRYSAEGEALWATTWGDNGPFLFNEDRGEHVVVLPDGDVVVGGTARPATSGNDVVLFRYDGETGAPVWDARYATSANERIDDLAIAGDGGLVVFGTDPFGIDRRWFVMRLEPVDGAITWTTLVDPGFDEFPRRLVIDPSGPIYALGGTDPDGDDDNFNTDVVVLALDHLDGSTLWTSSFGETGINDAEFVSDGWILPDGDLVAVGFSASPSVVTQPFDADAIVLRLAAVDGAVLEVTAFDTTEPNGPTRTDAFLQVGRDGTGAHVVRGISSGDVGVVPKLLLARFGGAACAADLDADGAVDGSDLGALLAEWGCRRGCISDLTGDGAVDGADLGLLLSAWGTCSE